MIKTKPVQIDGHLYEAPATATVADVVPWNVQSITTPAGNLITREQFVRTPVPEGFDTNLSTINKGDGIDVRHDGESKARRFKAAHAAIARFLSENQVGHWANVTGRFIGRTALLTTTTAFTAVSGVFFCTMMRTFARFSNSIRTASRLPACAGYCSAPLSREPWSQS